MCEYYITYNERSYMITPPDPSGEQWSDQGSSGIDVTLKQISRSEPVGPYEKVVSGSYHDEYGVDDIEPGKPVFVVWAKYRDGDTFGSSEYWQVIGVKADAADAVEAKTKAYQPDPKNKYRPWDGYFASLQEVTIETMMVGP